MIVQKFSKKKKSEKEYLKVSSAMKFFKIIRKIEKALFSQEL